MSAVRRVDRRAARNHHSSPYSRATTPKKSPWSISGLLSYIIPPRSRSPVLANTQAEQSKALRDEHASAAQSLSARGHQMSHDRSPDSSPSPSPNQNAFDLHSSITSAPITPSRDAIFSSDNMTPSPAKNLETVAAFLTQKAGQPLNQVEAAGLVALINQSTDNVDKPEPFRFSSSPTPARGNSPIVDFMNPGSSNSTNIHTPRKTLPKNPNGVYRWEGGGSARPRNRYRSPAFGSPRSSSPKIRLSPPETPRTDTKRRRVGEDASSSLYAPPPHTPPPSRSSAPSPPSRHNDTATYPFPVSNGASPAINGTFATRQADGASLPRLRTSNVPPKPTAPAIPSPLRQTWSQSESSSPPASRPTQAANFMTELIKEVTPPRKPDVSNPYQTASPVKPLFKKPVKRPRATGKPSAPTKAKEQVLSPQAIIEATVPKGSKRSRPPTNLEKPSVIGNNSGSPPTDVRRSPQPDHHLVNGINGTSNDRASPPPIVIEEVDEDQEDRTAKKKKKTSFVNGTDHHVSKLSVTIEEITNIDIPLASPPIRPAQIIEISDQTSSKPAPAPASAPISVSPANVPGSPQSGNRVLGMKSSAPKEPSKLRFSYQPDIPSSEGTPPSTAQSTHHDEEKARKDPRKAALEMTVRDLPSFIFTIGASFSIVASGHVTARNTAKTAPVSSLPTFDFSALFKPIKGKATTAALSGFDWAAAAVRPPAKSATETWTCSLCMLSNPASAVDKCDICEAPRISQDPKTKPASFDWAAAGMKPPSKTSDGTWTCSMCMLPNPATAVDKCPVCDTPR